MPADNHIEGLDRRQIFHHQKAEWVWRDIVIGPEGARTRSKAPFELEELARHTGDEARRRAHVHRHHATAIERAIEDLSPVRGPYWLAAATGGNSHAIARTWEGLDIHLLVPARFRFRIDDPATVKATTYVNDMRDVIKNRALAYEKEGNRWKQDMLLGNDRGGGGALFTTASDLTYLERGAHERPARRVRQRKARSTGNPEQPQEARRDRRAQPYRATDADLKAFAGRYESDELKAAFQMAPGNGGLIGRLCN